MYQSTSSKYAGPGPGPDVTVNEVTLRSLKSYKAQTLLVSVDRFFILVVSGMNIEYALGNLKIKFALESGYAYLNLLSTKSRD